MLYPCPYIIIQYTQGELTCTDQMGEGTETDHPPPPRIIQTNEIHIGKLQKLGLGTPSPLPQQTKLLHNLPFPRQIILHQCKEKRKNHHICLIFQNITKNQASEDFQLCVHRSARRVLISDKSFFFFLHTYILIRR